MWATDPHWTLLMEVLGHQAWRKRRVHTAARRQLSVVPHQQSARGLSCRSMDIDLQSSHPHALVPRTLTNTRIATATSIRLMKTPSSTVIVGARLGGLTKFDLTPGGGAAAGMLARETEEVMTTGIAGKMDRLGKSGDASS